MQNKSLSIHAFSISLILLGKAKLSMASCFTCFKNYRSLLRRRLLGEAIWRKLPGNLRRWTESRRQGGRSAETTGVGWCAWKCEIFSKWLKDNAGRLIVVNKFMKSVKRLLDKNGYQHFKKKQSDPISYQTIDSKYTLLKKNKALSILLSPRYYHMHFCVKFISKLL